MNGLIIALVLLGILWWWLSRNRRLLGRAGSVRRGVTGDSIPPRLMSRLDHLTRDRRVSERLIERIAFNNPGRSKSWCVEKAIYDLQRDRRS
ncbi:MAG: hypothetical protein AAFQ89_16990 [Cyanobacteria bacterium J06626_18]